MFVNEVFGVVLRSIPEMENSPLHICLFTVQDCGHCHLCPAGENKAPVQLQELQMQMGMECHRHQMQCKTQDVLYKYWKSAKLRDVLDVLKSDPFGP
eukprot:4639212-Amphidinium_carterae.2